MKQILSLFSKKIKNHNASEQGVTVVELIVVMLVSSVMIITITGFALDYWGNVASVDNDEQTLTSRLNAGDTIREAINASSGLITQNDLTDAHPASVEPTDATGTHWKVIHALPGTTALGAAGTITPIIYLSYPAIDTSKNIVMNGTIPYENNRIIYMNGTTKQLLARTIANPNALNNKAKTTCAVPYVTSACQADTIIADDLSSVSLRYFSRSGNTIDYTSAVDSLTGNYIGPDFPLVEVVELKIQLAKKAQLHNKTASSSQTIIRVALRN